MPENKTHVLRIRALQLALEDPRGFLAERHWKSEKTTTVTGASGGPE
jgi:hypothetical protein